jgi:hypothetical protein
MGITLLHNTNKDNPVCCISDFREVNKQLVRKPFLIPKINMLQELEGFTFATALDLNMGYYTIPLDTDASKICTIIFPWRSILPLGYQWVLHVLLTFFR